MKLNKIRTIVIEDNLEMQEYLKSIIEKDIPEIEIIGYAESVIDSVKLIKQKKPELTLMDIELSDGDSFEIFKQIDSYDFEVIFITGFDNYVKKAIEHYAFSFISKPIDPDIFKKTIDRYLNFKERLFNKTKYELLSSFVKDHNSQLLVYTGDEYISIKIDNIIKCISNGNYTKIHLANGNTILASRSLKHYESLFECKGFFKAHRATLVNVRYIKSIYKRETIILKNQDKIHVSVRNKNALKELITLLS